MRYVPDQKKGMTTAQANRLLRASQSVLESKEPRRFGMHEYFHWCGTPACVLGHYGSRRDLQRLLKRHGDSLVYVKTGAGADYYDITVHEHFGISSSEALELFSSQGCGRAKTPLQASKYIEKFVKSKGFDIKEVK